MFLEVDQISTKYPGALHDAVVTVSLAMAAGEIGVLLGPSGSGKTTLLRSIAGLQHIRHGCITLGGVLLDQAQTQQTPQKYCPIKKRRIGMVFQDLALFPHLTVADNIGFGLTGWTRQQQQARIKDMLTLVGLTGCHQQFPHQLSGGQQQRIALARSLAPEPALLLLDEPFSSLDPCLRERLAQDVRDILKQAKMTALMVTHDQCEAFTMADKVGVMENGHLHQWCTPSLLYHRPATRFVANFIGEGVFIRGKFIPIENTPHLVTDIGMFKVETLPEGLSQTSNDHLLFDMLVRADDVLHDDQAPTTAQIVRKTFRGATFLYTLQTQSGQELLALVPSHHDHAVGEFIGITLDMKHVVMFPAAVTSS